MLFGDTVIFWEKRRHKMDSEEDADVVKKDENDAANAMDKVEDDDICDIISSQLYSTHLSVTTVCLIYAIQIGTHNKTG